MVVKSYVQMALSSSIPTHSWAFGKKALGHLYDCDSRLNPDRVGLDETELRKKLPCKKVGDLEQLWAPEAPQIAERPKEIYPNLYWKRSSPLKARGTFSHSSFDPDHPKKELLPASVELRSNYSATVDFVSLFKKWCALYQPDQGYLHYFTEPELANAPYVAVTIEQSLSKQLPPGAQGHDDWETFRMGSFGTLWNKKTFNLGVFSYFSSTVLPEDAVDRLRADGFAVTRVGAGYFLELGASLATVKEDFETFSEGRHRAKLLVGLDLFEIRDEPEARCS